MEKLFLPNNYFEMEELSRQIMAYTTMDNIKDVVQDSIDIRSKDFVYNVIKTRINQFEEMEEYEQADFLNHCIKYIDNNF